MKPKLLTLFLALGPVLYSQTGNTPGEKKVIKIVRVHGDARALAGLAGNNSSTFVESSEQLKAVVIKGFPSDVAAVERTIQELDAGASAVSDVKNIEVVVYVIGGSMEPLSGVSETSSEALTPVLKQLRAVFPYKNYRTLSTMLLRSGQGTKTISSGLLNKLPSTGSEGEFLAPSPYQIDYDSALLTGGTSSLIHLTKFKFTSKIPTLTSSGKNKDGSPIASQYQENPVESETDVDLREGQKVVVATSNLGNLNASLFLVLTARVVQ